MDLILAEISDEPLPEDCAAEMKLANVTKDLKLRAIQGEVDSPLREKISGATFVCEENPLGMKKFRFNFNGTDEGEFHYTNAQGDKVIPFGINKNVFGKFPQLGYSNEKGCVTTTDGFMYDDAVSLCWTQDNRIMMYVQIIDKYFGNMSAVFGFNGDEVACKFTKAAEHFLKEYEGEFVARRMK